MGLWSMHIEGGGIHDNGRGDDADAMLKEFAGRLAEHHQVQSVTFMVGTTRELAPLSGCENCAEAGEPASNGLASNHAPLGPAPHAWRSRGH